jgi:hypothetical protein
LAVKLVDECCLLVIEDMGNNDDLKPFLQGGERFVHLITTRQFDVIAEEVAAPIPVDEMMPDEAAALLTLRLKPTPADLAPFYILAERLGQMHLHVELARAALGSSCRARQRSARCLGLWKP